MSVDRPSWAPVEVDPTRPSVARVYDFYLGGSHNFESDRQFGQHVLRAMPRLPTILREAREFLRRVVVYLCQAGIDQFLDLGSGIPTVGNVHEVAQSVNPRARVVYVDHDAVAIAHSHALLEGNRYTAAVQADLREPVSVGRSRRHRADRPAPTSGGVVAVGPALHPRPGPTAGAGRPLYGGDRAGQLSGAELRLRGWSSGDRRRRRGLRAARLADAHAHAQLGRDRSVAREVDLR